MTFYTVYRTQNLANGKYYFGVHKTKNPYDEYLGSGVVLKRAIAKYGEWLFIKNVCFIYDNAEEAFAKEFELIETYRNDQLCYNLRQGGSGGFDWINAKGLCSANTAPGLAAIARVFKLHPEKRSRPCPWLLTSDARKKANAKLQGHKHPDSVKRLISLRASERVGSKNSQFGTHWITDGIQNRKVKEGFPIPIGWCRGRSKALVAQRTTAPVL